MDKEKLQRELHQGFSNQKEAGIQLLQKMVQQKSVQGNENGVQKIVIEKLEELKLDIDVWEIDERELKSNPYFSSSRKSFKNSLNVVGVLKGRGGGKSIVLNGHVDVVPEGNLLDWIDDPYSGNVKDGKLYGRGATDMKGGNASLLLAIDAIQSLKIPLKGDIIFQSVIEEESGGAGTLAAVLKGYKGDGAIIPEPTNMKIFPKQQGSIWFRLQVKGRSAHGGTRYEGVSAIEKSISVLQHIQRLEQIRNKRVIDKLYENIPIPYPINIGKITGGDWPSTVSDLVTIEGRLGISPEETVQSAKKQFEKWMEMLQNQDPWFKQFPVTIEWFGACWPPGSIDVNHPLIGHLTDNYRNVVKDEPTIEASPWATDGGYLTNVGNTPTVVFGPGRTEMAHFANEYVEIEKVFQVAEIIALTVIDWCNQQKE